MPGIFISYRRKDTAYQAGPIYDRLVQHFGGQVFKDVDSIPLGDNFVRVIGEFIERSAVVLVLIGDAWLAADPSTGRPRLDDPSDFVRREIELALRGQKVVVPVFLGQAQMPEAGQLPESLRALTSRDGWRVHPHPHFQEDMERLIRTIEPHVRPAQAASLPGSDSAAGDSQQAEVRRVRCPSCGRKVKLTAAQQGQRVRCASCQHIFADISQLKKVSRDVPDKAPPREMPTKDTASPSENRVDTSALPRKAKGGSEATKRVPAEWNWRWPVLAGMGVMLVALLGLWASGVFKVKTKDGTIVLENLPPDADVTVDGQTVTVKSGDGKTFEVRVDPRKKHRLEVKKEGFKVFGEEVEVDAGGRKPVVVRLEKEVRPTPPKPIPEDKEKWVSLFNGKDKTGWKTQPESENDWHVENGVLIWRSMNPSHLWTERDDYRDFHLRVETRISDRQYAQVIVRDPFGQAGEVHAGYGIVLNCTNENSGKTGSVVGFGREFDVKVWKSPVRPDQWFTLEVIAEGNRVVVKVNEQTTADYHNAERRFDRGHITLFAGNRGFGQRYVEFRRIEIKELPARKTELPNASEIGRQSG